MRKYLVTYNIVGKKADAKLTLVSTLQGLSAIELFPDQWMLESDADAEDLCNRLKVLIDMNNDGLAVVELTDNVAFRQALRFNDM